MAKLSAQDILRVWEAGVAQDPVGRALAVLAAASPGWTHEALAALPVGRRDARLLEIREETFGPTLNGVSPCPRCGERIEFTLEIPELRDRVGTGTERAEGELRLENWSLRYRLPTSSDLTAAAGCGNPDGSRRVLAGRCILEARRAGLPVESHEVPPETIPKIAMAMAELDPWAEVLLDFCCPACGHAGQTLFDIAAYLWEEICAQALRLIHEVHALARAYGWGEADILALSATRRRTYLEMAS